MNIKGKLVDIFDEQQITGSFKKREFVVEYSENPQYPEYIKFELIQDKCSVISSFQIGQEIDVHFNMKGRKWNDPKGGVKYFNTLQAWRITEGQQQTNQGTGQTSDQPTTQANSPAGEAPPAWLGDDNDEDVPF